MLHHAQPHQYPHTFHQIILPTTHYDYLAVEQTSVHLGDFLEGSSVVHSSDHGYTKYFPDRGQPPYRARGEPSTRTYPSSSSSSLSSPEHPIANATGLAISGSQNTIHRPLPFPDNSQQPWQWAPCHAQLSEPNFQTPAPYNPVNVNSSIVGPLRLPGPRLTTPAAMAVLLNVEPHPNTPVTHIPAQPPGEDPTQFSSTLPLEGHVPVEVRSREKKHGCWMCHKSFDRPSTLRKHLLVHTGEKAHVCDTCGRRFGVASNLNRHVRKCILKPVNTVAGTAASPADSEARSSPSASINSPTVNSPSAPTMSGSLSEATSSSSTDHLKKKRGRTTSTTTTTAVTTTPATPAPTQSATTKPVAKRRRRPPSPSQWIPFSLLAFNLLPDEFHKSTPVPLPPVSKATESFWPEERNSWDENVSDRPYHPDGWKGRLPGPGLTSGLGTKDVGNLYFGEEGKYVVGRLVLT